MQPEDLLWRYQKPATGFYPDSSLYPPTLSLRYILILSSQLFPGLLSSYVPTHKILHSIRLEIGCNIELYNL
jgi:hypothetical protein